MKLRTTTMLPSALLECLRWASCLGTTLATSCELMDGKLALRSFVADQVMG